MFIFSASLLVFDNLFKSPTPFEISSNAFLSSSKLSFSCLTIVSGAFPENLPKEYTCDVFVA